MVFWLPQIVELWIFLQRWPEPVVVRFPFVNPSRAILSRPLETVCFSDFAQNLRCSTFCHRREAFAPVPPLRSPSLCLSFPGFFLLVPTVAPFFLRFFFSSVQPPTSSHTLLHPLTFLFFPCLNPHNLGYELIVRVCAALLTGPSAFPVFLFLHALS